VFLATTVSGGGAHVYCVEGHFESRRRVKMSLKVVFKVLGDVNVDLERGGWELIKGASHVGA
jgi:hypothetical protein